MFGSFLVYAGVVIAIAGLLFARGHRIMAAGIGLLLTIIGFALPAPERRILRPATHLDEFFPVWQFNEVHSIHVAAPPDRVFAAIRAIRADEILLFRTLIWIRRGGRPQPESILNPVKTEPLLDVATRTTFIYLADDPPRELVVGTVIAAPRGTRGTLTPAVFKKRLRPGIVLAGMNFRVLPDQRGGSLVSTETRVNANSDSARRQFAAYWRVIYPGSSLIRRMWLRAIARRAERGLSPSTSAGDH
jgi:hypothetical protein